LRKVIGSLFRYRSAALRFVPELPGSSWNFGGNVPALFNF
jgi:hypothetical protein